MSLAAVARDARMIAEAERKLLAARGGKRGLFSLTPSRRSSFSSRMVSQAFSFGYVCLVMWIVNLRAFEWTTWQILELWFCGLLVNRSDTDDYLELNDFERLRIPSVSGLVFFRWLVHVQDELFTGLLWGAGAFWLMREHASLESTVVTSIAVALLPAHLATFHLWLATFVSRCKTTATKLTAALGMDWVAFSAVTGTLAGLVLAPAAMEQLPWHPWTAPALIAYFLIATPLFLRNVLLNPPNGQEDDEWERPSKSPSSRRVTLPTEHVGHRSLLGNQLRLFRGGLAWHFGRRIARWPIFGLGLVFAALPAFFGYLSVTYGASATEISLLLPLAAVMFGSRWFIVEEPEWAYLYGVDLRAVRTYNVKCALASIGGIPLVGVLVALAVHGFQQSQLAAGALLGALVLLRSAGLLGYSFCWLLVLASVVTLIVRTPWVTPQVALIIAGAVAALGAWAMGREVLRSEATLRRSMRESEEDDEDDESDDD